MKKKRWGFLLKVFLIYEDGETFEAGQFEAMSISPYKLVSGGAYTKFMESDNYDHLTNPLAIGDFISQIGDKNTLSVKKLRDPLTDLFAEVKRNDQSITAINLFVTPLSAVSPKYKGVARLQSLFKNAVEMVRLKDVVVTYQWHSYYAKGGNPLVTYDYVTFETEENPKFLFRGKDY